MTAMVHQEQNANIPRMNAHCIANIFAEYLNLEI